MKSTCKISDKKIRLNKAKKNLWKASLPGKPAEKVDECFPKRHETKICGLCESVNDCPEQDLIKTTCPNFSRRRTLKETPILENASFVAGKDLSHINKKAYALAKFRKVLLQQQEFHLAEVRRLEKEIREVEKDISHCIVTKTLCPAYTGSARLYFREAPLDKPEAKLTKVAKPAKPAKPTKADWSAIELF